MTVAGTWPSPPPLAEEPAPPPAMVLPATLSAPIRHTEASTPRSVSDSLSWASNTSRHGIHGRLSLLEVGVAEHAAKRNEEPQPLDRLRLVTEHQHCHQDGDDGLQVPEDRERQGGSLLDQLNLDQQEHECEDAWEDDNGAVLQSGLDRVKGIDLVSLQAQDQRRQGHR